MIQLKDFNLLKHFVCIKEHLADNVGILKSLEIEYNEIIDYLKEKDLLGIYMENYNADSSVYYKKENEGDAK